jgi:two-component system response regulator ResD
MNAVRILLVEDEDIHARPLKQLLEFRGYEVQWVRDWREAREMILQFTPELAIVDLYLATADDMEGFDVIKWLRAALPTELGIMAWSMNYVDARYEVLALRAGADDFVRKGTDVGLVEARIEALLRRINRQP